MGGQSGKCCSSGDVIWPGNEPDKLSDAEVDKLAKEFIDKYTPHGSELTPAQKELVFRTLKEGDPTTFSDTLLWITRTNAERTDNKSPIVPNRYVMYSQHTRADYQATAAAKGDSEYCSACFIGNLIVGRYQPDQGDPVPEHVGLKNKGDVLNALSTIKLNAEGVYSPGEFYVYDQALLKEIYDITHELDWSSVVTSAYAVVPLSNGTVYSPAWNAIYLIFENDEYKSDDQAVMWIMQSATSDGSPSKLYPGPSLNKWWISEAGIQFTPFADAKNYYGYNLKINPNVEDIELLNFTVKAFHKSGGVPTHDECIPIIGGPQCSEEMYLQVSNTMTPATEEDIECHDKHLLKNIQDGAMNGYATILKGALVYDIAEAYYPDDSRGELMHLVNLESSDKVSLGDRATGTILDLFSDADSSGMWVTPPGPGVEYEKVDRTELRKRINHVGKRWNDQKKMRATNDDEKEDINKFDPPHGLVFD